MRTKSEYICAIKYTNVLIYLISSEHEYRFI